MLVSKIGFPSNISTKPNFFKICAPILHNLLLTVLIFFLEESFEKWETKYINNELSL